MRREEKPSRLRTALGTVGGLVLGAVLLVAAVAKALDIAAFAEQIAAEGLGGILPAGIVAFLALALEVGLGILLVLGVRRWWVLWPSAGLVVLFVFLTGRSYWRFLQGEEVAVDCGCFGNLVSRTPAEAFWQDLMLLVPALLLAFVGRQWGGRFPTWRTVLAVVGAGLVMGFAYLAPDLPLDDVATRLAPEKRLDEICVGDDPEICLADIAPELSEGEHWGVLVDLEAGPERWVDRLNELALSGRGAAPVVFAAATPEELAEFRWTWGPAFEIRETPEPLLRSLYRELPRHFLVREGVVVLTSRGLPGASADTPDHR